MKYVKGFLLALLSFSSNCFSQETIDYNDSLDLFSNFNTEFKVDTYVLSNYCKGYILAEGELFNLDQKGKEHFSNGERVQIIFQAWRFNDSLNLDLDSSLKVNICDYNSHHYYIGPSGGRVAIYSQSGESKRCFITQYNNGEEREILNICPHSEIPLLLCAEIL